MSDQPSSQRVIKAMMVCAMGMSSSLLEIKTKEAAARAGIPFEIKAVAVNEITRWDPKTHPIDIILVAPQVFYKRKALEIVGELHGVIVQGIDPMTFGMVDGDKLFDQIMTAVRARDAAKTGAKPPEPEKPAAVAEAKAKEAEKPAASADAKPKEPEKPAASADAKPKLPEKPKELAKAEASADSKTKPPDAKPAVSTASKGKEPAKAKAAVKEPAKK